MYPPVANWNILFLGNLKKICDKLRGPRRVLHSNEIKKCFYSYTYICLSNVSPNVNVKKLLAVLCLVHVFILTLRCVYITYIYKPLKNVSPKVTNCNILFLGNLNEIFDELRRPRGVLHSKSINKIFFFFYTFTKLYTHRMHFPKEI